MGWKPRCIILLEQFNQNVIWQGDSWYVWGESKGMKNHLMCCAHVYGASIQLDSTLKNLTKSRHQSFIVGAYIQFTVVCMNY